MNNKKQKSERKILTVIGLMSGTSFDSIDAALMKTDGETIHEIGACVTLPYPEYFREKIRKIIFGEHHLRNILEVEDEITLFHCKAVRNLLKITKMKPSEIDLVAFHGQTIFHDAKKSKTWQLANGSLMADQLGINVITDFRRRDLAKGGEGAPLVCFYHRALAENLPKPVVFINIGGVSNLTYIGEDNKLIAFDAGPGCALIDDWVFMRLKKPYDENGEIARSGFQNKSKVDYLIENHSYFKKAPPKSLDRNEFNDALRKVSMLTTADGAATLTEFTARGIYEARKFLPDGPMKWLACGGGRLNRYLIYILQNYYKMNIDLIDNVDLGGFRVSGDYVEAQAFAFLGARCYYNMPISVPETTGVIQPASGGAFYQA